MLQEFFEFLFQGTPQYCVASGAAYCYGLVVMLERGVLAAAAGAILVREIIRRRKGDNERRLPIASVVFVLTLAVLGLCSLIHQGRPILSPWLVDHGSLLSRCFVFPVSPWIRRLCEPALLVLLAALQLYSARRPSRRIIAVFWLTVLLWFVESAASSLIVQHSLGRQSTLILPIAHALGVQVYFALLALVLADEIAFQPLPKAVPSGALTIRRMVNMSLITAAFASLLTLFESVGGVKPLVGAHYYSWFPENWAGHYSGRQFDPPVIPLLGEYSSDDPVVFNQHVEWAKQAGIDYFVFDWWPKRREIRRRVKESVRLLREQRSFNYVIQYETLDLKEAKDQIGVAEDANVIIMTPDRAERLKMHWEHLARNYMNDENYLRVSGRPVLFVYAVRHLVGPVLQAVTDARRHVYRQTGIELFLVADEAFYNVLDFDARGGVTLLPEMQPNWKRLSAFDAVTCYNPYDPQRTQHGRADLGRELFLSDVQGLYRRYFAISSTLGIPFIPSVITGYDDRGVRPAENHYAISRKGSTEASAFQTSGESLFERALDGWITPFLPERMLFFTITSWNEWNESTQVEPASRMDSGSSQPSKVGKSTQLSSSYDGYLFEYLSMLRSFTDQFKRLNK